MGKQNRRMGLTLPPELEAALRDMSEATDRPAATIVVELLSEMVPQLHAIAKIARQAKAGKSSAIQHTLDKVFTDAQARIDSAKQRDLFGVKGAKK